MSTPTITLEQIARARQAAGERCTIYGFSFPELLDLAAEAYNHRAAAQAELAMWRGKCYVCTRDGNVYAKCSVGHVSFVGRLCHQGQGLAAADIPILKRLAEEYATECGARIEWGDTQ